MEEKTLVQISSDLFDVDIGSRQILERGWYRNILYMFGSQWIRWNDVKKGFIPAYRHDKDQPQPVDNIILDYIRSVKALILNKDLKTTVWPNSNQNDDIMAAELAEKVLFDIDARNGYSIKDEYELAAMWMLLCGTSFLRDYPDMGMGKWIGATGIKTGDIATEAIMPFNVFVDENAGVTLRDKAFFGIQSIKTNDWLADTFPDFKPEKADKGDRGRVNYQRGLMDMIGQVTPWKSAGSFVDSNKVKEDNFSIMREIEFRPTKAYPKGRYAVLVGDQILLDEKRMPIPVQDDEWFYSLEDIRHNPAPGRFWGEPGVNSLIPMQDTINKIDAALVKNREGIGRPWVISPIGTHIRSVSNKGSSVNMIEFDGLSSGGIAPQVRFGIPLPGQVLTERDIQKASVQEASGDPKNVLRGGAPSGSSGLMVDILRETAEAGHSPDIVRFWRAVQRSARKRIVLAQVLFSEERILKIAGADGKPSIVQFKGSDLRGNNDVRFEFQSGFSSTNAGRVGVIQSALQSGLFNDQVVKPDVRKELMRIMGLGGFTNKISQDLRRAENENQKAVNEEADKLYIEIPVVDPKTGEPPLLPDGTPATGPGGVPLMDIPFKDPIFPYDNHVVHFDTHRKFIVSAEFGELPEKDQTLMIAHAEAHKLRIDAAEAEAKLEQVEMSQPQGAPGQMQSAEEVGRPAPQM